MRFVRLVRVVEMGVKWGRWWEKWGQEEEVRIYGGEVGIKGGVVQGDEMESGDGRRG